MINAVRQWLQTHTNWLLILDNVDDLSLVQPLLPPVSHGHIILTIRTQATGRFAHRIEIDTLQRDDGALLLLRRAGMLAAQGSLEHAAKQEITIAHQISEDTTCMLARGMGKRRRCGTAPCRSTSSGWEPPIPPR